MNPAWIGNYDPLLESSFHFQLTIMPEKQKYKKKFQPFVYLKLEERQSVTGLPAMSKENSFTCL